MAAVGVATPAKASNTGMFNAELAGMEDAFCALAKEIGLLADFVHFAAPDVAFIDTDPPDFAGWPPCASAWALTGRACP